MFNDLLEKVGFSLQSEESIVFGKNYDITSVNGFLTSVFL